MKIRAVKTFLESSNVLQRIHTSKKAKKLGKFIAIELVYIPFIFFMININYGKKVKNLKIIFIIDCILGESAIYKGREEDIKDSIEIEVPDDIILPIDQKVFESIKKISEEEAIATLKKVLARKFKKIFSIEILNKELIYYPFYVIYFNKNNFYDIEVVNAVSGEFNNLWYKALVLKGLYLIKTSS
ncbi:MAG: hypothetical protein QXL51_07390 [Candidatus Aenigmatarchaeota archaeon]